jgi:asparagine synthase (glutamine-hydrolysing)
MCGICGSFQSTCCVLDPAAALRAIAHRGPDGASLVTLSPNSALGFSHLSLVGAAPQPFLYGALSLLCNGEIYNHNELRLELSAAPAAPSSSDCSVLLPCIAAWGVEGCVRKLEGMFALAAVRTDGPMQHVYLARDRMGIKPLLWGLCGSGRCLAFSSEARGLPPTWPAFEVPPGHVLYIRVCSEEPAAVVSCSPFAPPWAALPQPGPVTSSALRASLISAVSSHLMGAHPVGVFLSGGVDSSILAAVAARLYKQRGAALKSFTISHVSPHAPGAATSADLEFAKRTAEFTRSDLECFTFDTAEALAALPDVISHLESYDVGLVRVAVPLFLLAKKAAARGCRAVLVGEGADEVFAGYALFRAYARSDLPAFRCELERRLACISASELLRVDRCTMAFGVEARVPFLDSGFLSLAMHDSCTEKKLSHASTGRIEKYFLREAFEGWLPEDVLYRRKEGMADGVGFQWLLDVQQEASRIEGDADLERAEAALYKRLFLEGAHASRVALAETRKAARNARRPAPLSQLINGSALVRGAKSVRNDPELWDLFSAAEAAHFASSVLGVEVAGQQPTLHLLNSLVEAVLQRVPFHNFALLTRPRIPPTRQEVRQDWLSVLGGTCAYTSPAFAALLSALGFRVSLLAAAVRREFDHLALLVQVAGRLYYVDVGNGKRYCEAAPLGCDEPPLGPPDGFQWRVRWDAAASLFHVVHGRRPPEGGSATWDAAPSISFDPLRLVHYSFFYEHFQRARQDPANAFLHGLRFAVFPRLDSEISVRDAVLKVGAACVNTEDEGALVDLAGPFMTPAQRAWLQAALDVLKGQGDDLWPLTKKNSA